jgi:hypothetical protein
MTKGRVELPFGVMVVMTTAGTLFIPDETCRWQVSLLLNDTSGASRANWMLVERTAGPSTALRSGRDDNSFVTLTFPMINLRDVHCSLKLPQASRGAQLSCDEA